jgi:hypothetical protein
MQGGGKPKRQAEAHPTKLQTLSEMGRPGPKTRSTPPKTARNTQMSADTPSAITQCRDPMHPAGQPHKTDLSAQPINSKRGTHTPHGAPTQAPGSPPWTIKLKEPRGSHSQSHHGRSNLNTIPRHCQSHSRGAGQHPRHKSSWRRSQTCEQPHTSPNLQRQTHQAPEEPSKLPSNPQMGGPWPPTNHSHPGEFPTNS